MLRCPTCDREAPVGSSFCPLDGTPLSHIGRGPPILPRAGDEIDGRYRLIEELGRGGMAVVFRAHSAALGHDVALKVLLPRWAGDRRTVARFAREARSASQIDHDNVVKVYDFGWAENGFYFLTMEFLSGVPLDRETKKGPRMRPSRALAILLQIADGMAKAHEIGVVHRDLKPENVMIARENGRDRVTIVDFGLSKMDGVEAMVTGKGDVIGTPDFMAPEQWQGVEVDARADVYSFGVMAYELFAGELPFGGDTILAKLQQHLHSQPKPLRERVRDLPEGIDELVTRCLAKDRLDRPPHMGKVRAELMRIDAAQREQRQVMAAATISPEDDATVFAPVEDVSLDKFGLLREIERLRRVRQHRLAAVTPDALGGQMTHELRDLISAIERGERDVDAAGEELAIAEATLAEAKRARSAKEAELRAALIDANLELAVLRSALPGSVTAADRREAGTIDMSGIASAPLSEGENPDVIARARIALFAAERRLAEFGSSPDASISDSQAAVDGAFALASQSQAALAVLYDALEARLLHLGAPLASDMAQLDRAIAMYRSRLEHLSR